MTSKIIIDGVDVSGCRNYDKKTHTCRTGYRTDEISYCQIFTCDYKRWKQVEQQLDKKHKECIYLKSQLDFEVLKKECYEQAFEKIVKLAKELLILSEGEHTNDIGVEILEQCEVVND